MILPIALTLLLSDGSTKLQPAPLDEFKDRVDRIAREAVDKEGVPGLSIAVADGGQTILASGWGYADARTGVLATSDTSYAIGSLTRQFTAVGVLQLAEKKKLSLDDDLAKWLPDFPCQSHKVTLRQLLSNTSGVPGYADLAARHAFELGRDCTREQLFRIFADTPFEFAPGTQYSANNSGYLLLSMVIAKASGEEYTDYVQTRILEPAGLAETRFCAHGERAVGFARECKGLSDERELEIPLSNHPTSSTQSLCSNVKDLVRWQRALEDRLLIGENATREMRTSTDLGDGLVSGHGFATTLEETDFARISSHTGGIGGFRVRLAHYLPQDLTIVVIANCESAPVERLEAEIARAALDLVSPEIVDLPVSPAEIARCSGNWQIATQRVRTFEREGKLWYEDNELPPFVLMYQGRHVFVAAADRSIRITFRVEKERAAQSFEIQRGEQVSTGKRME